MQLDNDRRAVNTTQRVEPAICMYLIADDEVPGSSASAAMAATALRRATRVPRIGSP